MWSLIWIFLFAWFLLPPLWQFELQTIWGKNSELELWILVLNMYSHSACITTLCSDEGLTLETSANTLFTAFNISTSTLRWYILRFTATPTQTKTSSHRDFHCIKMSHLSYRWPTAPLVLRTRNVNMIQHCVSRAQLFRANREKCSEINKYLCNDRLSGRKNTTQCMFLQL